VVRYKQVTVSYRGRSGEIQAGYSIIPGSQWSDTSRLQYHTEVAVVRYKQVTVSYRGRSGDIQAGYSIIPGLHW